MRILVSDELDRLPDEPPYGFCIDPLGRYIVIRRMWGHIQVLMHFIPEVTSENWEYLPLNLGWIMVNYGTYVEYHADLSATIEGSKGLKCWYGSRATRKALSMMNDIAAWYSLKVYRMHHHPKVT